MSQSIFFLVGRRNSFTIQKVLTTSDSFLRECGDFPDAVTNLPELGPQLIC